MAQYLVNALKAQLTPRGPILDRIVGPGWCDAPNNVVAHLIAGRHRFALANSEPRLELAVRRDGNGVWVLMAIDAAGTPVPADSLPHWQLDRARSPAPARMNWWQRLLDPDAA